MADEMMGIEKLRRTSTQTKINDCRICEASGIKIDCDEYCNDERGRSLAAIADQIEREHAEDLAAAKRDLTDEAREAVERLRMVSHDDVLRSANPEHEIVDELCKAVGVERDRTYTGTLDAICNRIAELIEHGGKRDVDVSALRELADKIDACASYLGHGGRADLACNMSDAAEDVFGIDEETSTADARVMLETIAEHIREAVEGATVPDAEIEAERACAALLEWRDQVAGLLGIDVGSMADEVQDAIMDELDKRLMPPGMEWPRWEDGKQVSHYDTLEDATAICLALDGSCYSLHYDMPDGERVCLFDGGEGVERPEPEVLGADGKPIKVGETVWDSTSPNDPTSSTVWRHGGPLKVLRQNDVRAGNVICENDQGIPLDCLAADLTHAAPDTRERIDEDKRKAYDAYWGCDTNITCRDCPEVIDGMKPYEYYGVLNCRVAQGMDIARRKHELDAKLMGGAR